MEFFQLRLLSAKHCFKCEQTIGLTKVISLEDKVDSNNMSENFFSSFIPYHIFCKVKHYYPVMKIFM